MKKSILILSLFLFSISFAQDSQKARDIVAAGLVELGLSNVEVRIKPIPEHLKGLIKGHGDELEGFIRGGGDQYTLYLKDLNNGSLLRVISHELIHLKQIRENRLTTTTNNVVFWEGKEYSAGDMSYYDKPWENEAVGHGDDLRFKIKRTIKNQ